MRSVFHVRRHGATMVELLIFMTILAMISGLVLPLLFMATQTRHQQATVAAVEQNGAQALQDIMIRIRSAERVIGPLVTETGSFLVLQMSSGALSPTIIGLQSGSLILVEHARVRTLTSPQVGVTSFLVRNTSSSATRQSVLLSFRLARATRQPGPDTYERYFETAVSLHPADQLTPSPCACAVPLCVGSTVQWEVCDASLCAAHSTSMQCP